MNQFPPSAHGDTAALTGSAESCANIALAKYWGKSEKGDNLTAVPSLSLSLDALRTRTEVTFSAHLDADQAWVGGELVTGRPLERITQLMDRVRQLADVRQYARVDSYNNFPTAAGLASSASGFAALAMAAARAANLSLSRERLSSLARRSSASAGRSLFGGFSVLEAEADESHALASPSHWDVAMVVAIVQGGPKPISSTRGMLRTQESCPYYSTWTTAARSAFESIRVGVLTRDFDRVADGMEHSTRLMHATMMTTLPPVLYLRGATVELMHEIAARRAAGEPVAYTMDAGPNVKVLTLGPNAEATARWLASAPGVRQVIVCRPGPETSGLIQKGPLASAPREDGVELLPFVPPDGAPQMTQATPITVATRITVAP